MHVQIFQALMGAFLGLFNGEVFRLEHFYTLDKKGLWEKMESFGIVHELSSGKSIISFPVGDSGLKLKYFLAERKQKLGILVKFYQQEQEKGELSIFLQQVISGMLSGKKLNLFSEKDVEVIQEFFVGSEVDPTKKIWKASLCRSEEDWKQIVLLGDDFPELSENLVA